MLYLFFARRLAYQYHTLARKRNRNVISYHCDDGSPDNGTSRLPACAPERTYAPGPPPPPHVFGGPVIASRLRGVRSTAATGATSSRVKLIYYY